MRIGIDYTAAARQRAGIGRYARELITALLALEAPIPSTSLRASPGPSPARGGGESRQYVIFAAVGGLEAGSWKLEVGQLCSTVQHLTSNLQPPISNLQFRTLPISDDWLARLWQRLRLPVPVEAITGALDVFYSPDFVLPPTLPRTRTLLTVHDLSFLRCPDAFVPALRRYLERVVPRSIARAERVLADSEATRADLVALLGALPEKVQVLYSGVHPRFRPQPEPGEAERVRARYGLGDAPYALSVGTLQPRKNYPRLIQAFAHLRTGESANQRMANGGSQTCRLADLQLVIAGGRGWLYEETLAEAGKHAARVRVLGFVDDGDLPALYRNAALFVFPSLYEGFGLPVLEAMACGVPVICSNASSLPEVAGDAALLVDPLDTDGLAAAMARVLGDVGLRQQMIARGFAQAARFTWEKAARQLLAAFDALGRNA